MGRFREWLLAQEDTTCARSQSGDTSSPEDNGLFRQQTMKKKVPRSKFADRLFLFGRAKNPPAAS
jgi:hypothetical protein